MSINYLRSFLEEDEINIIELPSSDKLTLDSIYTRDTILLCDKGLILCNMGRASRTFEVNENFKTLSLKAIKLLER